MTSLLEVAGYLPPERVDLASLKDRLDFSDAEVRVFRKVFGLNEVRRDTGGSQTDLMLEAVAGLESFQAVKDRIRYVIQSRTMPTVAPYPVNPLAEVCDKLGLGNSVAFCLTEQACATGLFAVDLAGRLLRSDGDRDGLALVLVGEKTFTRAALQVPGSSVNGECAAAILVSGGDDRAVGGDRDRDTLRGYATRTVGAFYEFQSRVRESVVEFQRIYTDTLAEVLEAAAAQAGVAMGEVALILPHNVNRISWVRVAKRLGVPLDKVFLDNIPVTGHSFCADPFVNYVTARDKGLLRRGDIYLMTTVGLGATFSAMAFEH